jgi:hypothetical protein
MNKETNQGVIVTYSISKDYFVVGSVYRMHVGTNDYRNAVLVSRSDSDLEFKLFDGKGGIEDLKLTVDDLLYHDYDIVKLKPDYSDGVMKY